MFLPIQTLEYYEEISSTNDRVKELLRQSVKPNLPCLVMAKRQTSGRGRDNKRWWSGEGAMLLSLGVELSPELLMRDRLPILSVMVARSVMTILNRYLPLHKIELHLPNDVYVDGKKICGILLESPAPRYGVLGIGLNVNNRLSEVPPEFHADIESRHVTSMIELLGRETDISPLTHELLTELERVSI